MREPSGDEANSMQQSYSIEVDIDRDGRTLRMLATWVEIRSIWVDSDSAAVASSAVNKSQDSAERLSGICAGDITIAAE